MRKRKKSVETLTHIEDSRTNIPTAEYQSVMREDEQSPIAVAYERRNRDLDPQLVWRGKDQKDWSDLVVQAPPLYIQEKVHPKVLIDDLRRQTEADEQAAESQLDLFADFNGVSDEAAKTEFYQHDANWSNRMILGDSQQVMASLAEREGLRGKVQCIYLDPPYGIRFNSNFQWSTTNRDVKDGRAEHITREPEQVKAFRDTWRDGIHSYLTYLRDRLTVARDLLTDSGSIFVQIGDENVHRVRALMDEVFGSDNFVGEIPFNKTTGAGSPAIGTLVLPSICDYILWYAKSREQVKYRQIYKQKIAGEEGGLRYRGVSTYAALNRSLIPSEKLVTLSAVTSIGDSTNQEFDFVGRQWLPPRGSHWKTTTKGLKRAAQVDRLVVSGNSLCYVRCLDDFSAVPLKNIWLDIGGIMSRSDPKIYVVQTSTTAIMRCLLMSTDPGDLVLDPTCGSGTTAYVAEQWGRRWITIDTSRVALALARARIMGARYPYYLLADSREGQYKEAEVSRTTLSDAPAYGNLRQGFVYQRVPHITLKAIANNAEIDVIWDKFQQVLEPLRERINQVLAQDWQEWEIPREVEYGWPDAAKMDHADWWEQRIARQKEIDASIAAKADFEYLYDKPYEDNKKVRVAGPFTIESLSPHRVLSVDEDDELIDVLAESSGVYGDPSSDKTDFAKIILENLKVAGVQQSQKEDKIDFAFLKPWPGKMICAEGVYLESENEEGSEPNEKRAGIFIGPEFGTVSRVDLVSAAREAGDADFDVLIACAFSYDARTTDFDKLGRIPVLKARMNADLHMDDELKKTDKGNLFVIFGEPDIEVLPVDGTEQIQVKINGVDVFHPQSGEVRSDDTDGIACWFIDTDYNEESFFVRQAYFLGANDPYKSLKNTLKTEINQEAWETLYLDTSRPFEKPASGRIAVKVINHLGDEVMKVFRV